MTATDANPDFVTNIAAELSLPPAGVRAVVDLLAEGNTVPFIARYRKERTGALDEVQIRAIEERRAYLLELEERRTTVLASIREQGKLTPELEAELRAATTKAVLEDLYLPYKPKRRTRATIARDRGLEPLALRILAQPLEGDPLAEAAAFLGAEVPSAADALAGARDIVAEVTTETAEVRAFVRGVFADEGELVSDGPPVIPGKQAEPTKFEQYYAYREPVRAVPSHRFLAIRRGEAEGVLRAHVAVDHTRIVGGVERIMKIDPQSPWAAALAEAVADAEKRLLAPSVENDLRVELKLRSDAAAVDVFADNLRNLMLAAPLGGRAVVGVDPGLRTGCKCAAVDATGRFLGSITIFLTQGEGALAKAREELTAFIAAHTPVAIAIGNGTGGREAEAFVRRLLAPKKKVEKVEAPAPEAVAEVTPPVEGEVPLEAAPPPVEAAPEPEPAVAAPFVVAVNEAGASVYSASDVAREEFPDLDLTIRGAISIARRLQDPLAELVKIEPKAIGVGQYQHDVHQPLLAKKLGDVVESAVNHVGVELNTASAMLLGYVAGIGKALAKKIVVHREQHGAFAARSALLDVGGLGPRAYEQAAGFLRIRGGHPLDASAVHPERYALVEKMAADLGVEVGALVGNAELAGTIDVSRYVSDEVGEPTLRDIIAELGKPGRDPRAEFEPPKFREDVTTLDDLHPGMVLEGVVTNVTAFGAFVDLGVHQDGLVHVSQLSERYIKDPAEVVKVGDKLKVRVLEIDKARRRIALSARPPQQGQGRGGPQQQRGGQGRGGPQQQRGGGGGGGGGGPRGPRDGQQQQARGDGGGGGGGGGPRRDDRRGGGGGGPQQQQQSRGGGGGGSGPRRDDRGGGGGPRRDDRGGGGGGGDRGPRRDDRGPRRDDQPRQAQGDQRTDAPPPQAPDSQAGGKKDQQGQGYGISGFVNNPFAKLGDLKR